MDKNNFTIGQVLFLIFLLKLPTLVYAGGGGDEEPDGLSCETAFETTVRQQEAYTFNEEQESMFFTFTAPNDTILMKIEEAENTPFAEVVQVDIFAIGDCDNLTLTYSTVLNDSTLSNFFQINGLDEDAEYLIKLMRDYDSGLPVAHFEMLVDEFISFCPGFYVSNCGEMVKNGGFNHVSWPSSQLTGDKIGDAFAIGGSGIVCEWRRYTNSPDLFDKDDRTYAFMWCDNTKPGDYEDITTSVNITPGSYMFSIELAAEFNNTVYGIPDEFRMILRDNSTNPATETVAVSIPQSQIQRRTSSNDVDFPMVAVCFSASQNYDAIILRPYNNPQNNNEANIFVDNVSIKPITLDAGPDINLQGCEASATIGPSCVLPGATYSWWPTTGLSDPNIPNPTFSAAAEVYSQTYTLTMITACAVRTDQIDIDYNAGSGIDVVIPDGQTASWLLNELNISDNGNNQHTVFYRTLLVQGEFIIDKWVDFHSTDFLMTEGAKITVDDGMLQTSAHPGGPTKFISCNPDEFWDGIYVSGSDNGHAEFGFNTTVRNSINGMVFENGSVSYIEGVKFIDNGTAITFKNYSTMNYRPSAWCCQTMPLTISNCEFSAGVVSGESGFLPAIAVKVIDFYIDPNDSWTEPLWIHSNTFHGTGGGLYIENSDVEVHSNDFMQINSQLNLPMFPPPAKTDLAINIKGSDDVNDIHGVDLYNNVFIACKYGINSDLHFSYDIRDNYFNEYRNGNVVSGTVDPRFLLMKNNLSTPDPNQLPNTIKNNTIKNVKTGISLETVGGFEILNNTIDMEVQSNPSSYTQRSNKNSQAIYVNNFDIPVTVNDILIQRFISQNNIRHSKVGIQTSFVSSLNIYQNEILNSNGNMSPSCSQPSTCPTLDPFGIRVIGCPARILENEVTNDLSLYTNDQPYLRDNDMMVGISVENTAAPHQFAMPGVFCNKIENTSIAMRFLGSNYWFTQVMHNTMLHHYYGFVLKNNGFIGDVGVDGEASDNEWDGAYTGSKTLADNSDGSYCTLFVQSGGVYDPPINPIDRLNGGVAVQKDNSGNTSVSIGCTTPLMQGNSKQKQPQQNVSKSGGSSLNWGQGIKRGKMPYMIHASDSALMLDRQLLYYHLSKDTALLNDTKWKPFADSMKLTPMGRSMKQSQNSRSAVNNFEANLISIDAIAVKVESKDTLSQSDSLELRRVADLCPYYDGIAVYQARYLLHKLDLPVTLNDCERTFVDTSQRYIRLKNTEDTTKELFSLYPNPSQEWVTVDYVVEDNQEIFFELYDVLGKLHFKEQMKNANNHRFNLEGMHQGMYFYRLVDKETILEGGKLLIQK